MLSSMHDPAPAGPDASRTTDSGPAKVSLFVNGTLMRGEPLHDNLAGARFIGPARTAPRYRLLSVRDLHPAMIPAGASPGPAISGELYELDLVQLQRVLDHEPPGLGLGVVELEDGSRTLGILWTAQNMPESATEISTYGGWREYRTA
jgi:adenine/guanine/hypoxanthine permease